MTGWGRTVVFAVACLAASSPRALTGKSVDDFEVVTFRARDSLLVTAHLYRARSAHAPIILLFHQSGSSRGEY